MLNPMMEFENVAANTVNQRNYEVSAHNENVPKVALVAGKKLGLTYSSSILNTQSRTSCLIGADGRSTTAEFPDVFENGYITNNTSLMSKISKVDGQEPGRVSKTVKRASVNVNEVNRVRREAAARKSVRNSGGDSPVVDFRVIQAQARELAKKKEAKKECVSVIQEDPARLSKISDRQQRSKGLQSQKSSGIPTIASSKNTVGTVEIIRTMRGTSENRRLQREEKFTEDVVRSDTDVAPVQTKKKQSMIKTMFRKIVPKKSTSA